MNFFFSNYPGNVGNLRGSQILAVGCWAEIKVHAIPWVGGGGGGEGIWLLKTSALN